MPLCLFFFPFKWSEIVSIRTTSTFNFKIRSQNREKTGRVGLPNLEELSSPFLLLPLFTATVRTGLKTGAKNGLLEQHNYH